MVQCSVSLQVAMYIWYSNVYDKMEHQPCPTFVGEGIGAKLQWSEIIKGMLGCQTVT